MGNRFNIDFFEFCFLVEVCIPTAPIARTVFFQKVIDVYYHEMTQEERDRLYNWLNDNRSFQNGIDLQNELCLKFNARFDKDNQYLVDTLYGQYQCFKFNGKYMIDTIRWIVEKSIIEIEKQEV